MAKKATSKKTKKGGTRFQTLTTLKQTRKDAVTSVKKYHKKYTAKPIQKGKAFIKDMRRQPGNVIEDLWEDTREFAGDMRDDPRGVIDDFVDSGKDFFDDVGEDFKNAFKGTVDTGKEIFNSMEHDFWTLSGDLFDELNDYIDKNKRTRQIKKKVTKKLKSIPGKMDLPSFWIRISSILSRTPALSKRPFKKPFPPPSDISCKEASKLNSSRENDVAQPPTL